MICFKVPKTSKVRDALLPCLIIMGLSFFIVSCTKLVDIGAPVTSINANNVYTNDATAAAVLTGVYTNMSSTGSLGSGGITTISLYSGLSSDELMLWDGVSNPILSAYFSNALSANSNIGSEFWNYTYIFTCNSAIEGLTNSTSLNPDVKQQLLGEAKFMRAFFYFYLVNLFGDLPLVTQTDYTLNQGLPRSPRADIYEQIITDLKAAEALLSPNFLKSDVITISNERVRPTKWAAKALLARVYLYINDFVNAELTSSELIDNASIFSLSDLDKVFIKSSLGNNEVIWELQPVNNGWNTEDAKFFIIPETGFSGNSYPVYLSDTLVNSFEIGDERKNAWLGKYIDTVSTPDIEYYFPYKYKENMENSSVSEHLVVLRMAEIYLIRAEARAQLNNLTGAKSDLNRIRARAGLANTPASDKDELLQAILHERKAELFTEWGHRWFDLKRTNNVDAVMETTTPIKSNGAPWQSYQQLYPIPVSDIQANKNLTQNPGY
ncbi:RagB/SusD family nutrient uptake outer membrane protein [Longitalea arenae]|uniref:RagB/SusD family nutrient uptake outer membrane protein n=1 Tax=Longitalea arenae TaxID=2812558 RepID=UPI0019678BEC|nr:RagB/SusD family nutrient uptake outer membrane protein [Longitalea arenae]